jgi:hypothetical protein
LDLHGKTVVPNPGIPGIPWNFCDYSAGYLFILKASTVSAFLGKE